MIELGKGADFFQVQSQFWSIQVENQYQKINFTQNDQFFCNFQALF